MSLDLSSPIIYCISEGDVTAENFNQKKLEMAEKASKASNCGIGLYQIREKKIEARLICELAAATVKAARDTGLKILVNGRFDVALAAGAHGVQLPSDGVPAHRVRKAVKDRLVIGVSVHSLEEAIKAGEDGADFVLFAPVFETPGKGDGQGLEKLDEVCKAVRPLPVIALGGVDGSNIDSVMKSGALGYAAIRYLNRRLDEQGY